MVNEKEKENFDDEFEEKESPPLYPPPYKAKDNCLIIERLVKDNAIEMPLCNFIAWVEAEITRDDGAEQTKYLRIAGIHSDGTPLPPVCVASGELAKMNWFYRGWPSSCNLTVTNSVEKHLQFAIRSTAENAKKEYIFTHTGWQKIDGEWFYLLPENGVYDVQLTGKQKNYETASGASDYDFAVVAGMLDLDFIPQEVLLPCLALVFLSPLNEFLRQAGHEPKFVLTLIGHTGCMKSTVAALMLSFFGKFSATDLPMSFRDTANSILYNSFTLKDVLTCVDDYHPSSRFESAEMKKNMQNVCRGFGDRVARNGLTSMNELRPSRFPQGNVIVTAEQIPDVGESGIARLFCIEVPQNKINLPVLTDVQNFAADGMFMRVMNGYTEWLKSSFLTDEKYDSFIDALKKAYEEYRCECLAELTDKKIRFHKRIVDTVACLQIGFCFLLMFLKSRNMLTDETKGKYESAFSEIVMSLAESQSRNVEADNPAHIFIIKLFALVECGDVSIVKEDNAFGVPSNFIGYEDEQYYYLSLEASHRAVKKLCNMQDESFSINSRTLAKQLADENILTRQDGVNTKSRYFGGKNRRVMMLKKSEVEKVRGYA